MSKPIMSLAVACAVTVAGATAAARAGTTYLASSARTLYRVTEDKSAETFEFDVSLRGMHRDVSTGVIYVLGDEGGAATVYTLENPVSGTPTLSQYAELSRLYGTLTQIGNLFYGFSSGDLYQIDLSDPTDPIEKYMGSTGLAGTGGSGYDPVSATLYLVSYRSDALYTVDPLTADAVRLGSLGIDAYAVGAEWFADQLFVAAQNGSTGYLEIGTVDVTSGLYDCEMTLASGVDYVPTGLTLVPEPTTIGLLLTGSFLLLRRRGH